MKIRDMLRCELARRDFWEFCKLTAPDFYKEDRTFMKDMAIQMQEFLDSDSSMLVINLPPRHGKSRTASNYVKWYLGKKPSHKVMTGSYNETLSSTFAKQVRDAIQEIKTGDRIVYNDIFPNTKIKYGESAASLWALDGSGEKSYLATSPTGTATGFGCNLMIIDDLIKNAEEANNDRILEKHWDWFTNTMMQRTESGVKIIIIMTRWHSKDLAGKVLEEYKEYNPILITYKALENDVMLCEDILNKQDYELKIRKMSEEIASANYQQIPIDLKGRLYETLKTYNDIPKDDDGNALFTKYGLYCDSADEGNDYLCAIAYAVYNGDIYVLDVVYTQASMEQTELDVAYCIRNNGIKEADIESNNGGRGFARNVEKLLKKMSIHSTIRWFHQSGNKVARIRSYASQVMNRVLFPRNWKDKYPEFYRDVYKFQTNGKNQHDDAPDCLTGIIETVDKKRKAKVHNIRF